MWGLIFWGSLACIAYTYFGYPFALWCLASRGGKKVRKASLEPDVSIVISVRNEAVAIARKLDNLLKQRYPAEKLEIIVVSDGSTDDTAHVVAGYEKESRIKFAHHVEHRGKAASLNQGVTLASGEIIVFADARQSFQPDAVAELVANFADPEIGCVSGELLFVYDNTSRIQAEMGAYWRYEKWIRNMESRSGSVMGATGAIYAIRKKLYMPLPPDTILDDVLTPLNIIQQGYRCCFEGKATACDTFSKNAVQEWQRKVRTLAGNWQLLSLSPALIVPWQNPSLWWRYMSHKVMRLVVPCALVCTFISGWMQAGTAYKVFAAILSCMCSAGLSVVIFPKLRAYRIINTLYFIVLMNAAVVAGGWRWLTGTYRSVWLK